MQESDTYLMILDEGQEKRAKKDILIFGEEKFGPPAESVKAQLESITNLERLDRMVRRSVKAANWQEILDTLEPGGGADLPKCSCHARIRSLTSALATTYRGPGHVPA